MVTVCLQDCATGFVCLELIGEGSNLSEIVCPVECPLMGAPYCLYLDGVVSAEGVGHGSFAYVLIIGGTGEGVNPLSPGGSRSQSQQS